LIVAALPDGELRRQLASSGLRLRVGPIVTELRSPFPIVATSIARHYAAHELASRAEFADFHVSVEPPPGIRRVVKPQALFRFEGYQPFKPLTAAQAFPLFEWGLNWCISAHCHQYLLIHAAAVERGGRAMILPAPPGSGKSTLCAALVACGWRLLSDELTIIDIANGRIVPIPRPISLKNESIDVIRRFWTDVSMSEVVHDTVKGSVVHATPPRESVARAAQDAAPGWVVLPQFRAGEPTVLDALSRAAAFMQLADNAFNYSIHGRTGFDVLARLVADSGCFRFSYGGALDEAVRALDALAQRP
jgi:HprK-related kinase A